MFSCSWTSLIFWIISACNFGVSGNTVVTFLIALLAAILLLKPTASRLARLSAIQQLASFFLKPFYSLSCLLSFSFHLQFQGNFLFFWLLLLLLPILSTCVLFSCRFSLARVALFSRFFLLYLLFFCLFFPFFPSSIRESFSPFSLTIRTKRKAQGKRYLQIARFPENYRPEKHLSPPPTVSLSGEVTK